METKKGVVIWFNNTKGFGFIRPEGSETDLFVHHSCIDMDGYRTLKEGQLVSFEVENGPTGKPQAVEVKLVNMREASHA